MLQIIFKHFFIKHVKVFPNVYPKIQSLLKAKQVFIQVMRILEHVFFFIHFNNPESRYNLIQLIHSHYSNNYQPTEEWQIQPGKYDKNTNFSQTYHGGMGTRTILTILTMGGGTCKEIILSENRTQAIIRCVSTPNHYTIWPLWKRVSPAPMDTRATPNLELLLLSINQL